MKPTNTTTPMLIIKLNPFTQIPTTFQLSNQLLQTLKPSPPLMFIKSAALQSILFMTPLNMLPKDQQSTTSTLQLPQSLQLKELKLLKKS
jgi:hypothetical protein